jgi:hypothetical protein
MIYLMSMQIGNAMGVQAVGLSEMWHLGVPGTAGLLALLPLVLSIGTVACVRFGANNGASKPGGLGDAQ